MPRNCPRCSVQRLDRRCQHEEPVCFDCCSTSPTVRTCAAHFASMGMSAQTARAEAALGPLQAPQADSPPLPQPPPGAQQAAEDAVLVLSPPLPPSGSATLDLAATTALIAASVSAALSKQRAEFAVALAADLSTQRAELAVARAADLAAFQASQQAAIDALRADFARALAPAPPAPASPRPPPLIHPPPPSAPAPAPSSPHPHRAAVLGGQAEESLHGLLHSLAHPELVSAPTDASSREVRPQANTHPAPSAPHVGSSAPTPLNPLPASMVPTEVGSVQHNTQLLANLITTFHRKEQRYSSLRALPLSQYRPCPPHHRARALRCLHPLHTVSPHH